MPRFMNGKFVREKYVSPQEKYESDGKFVYRSKVGHCGLAAVCFVLATIFIGMGISFLISLIEADDAFSGWIVFFCVFILALIWVGLALWALYDFKFYKKLCNLLLEGDPEAVKQVNVKCSGISIKKTYKRSGKPGDGWNNLIIMHVEQDGEKQDLYYVVQRQSMMIASTELLREKLKGEWRGLVYENSPFLYQFDAEAEIATILDFGL